MKFRPSNSKCVKAFSIAFVGAFVLATVAPNVASAEDTPGTQGSMHSEWGAGDRIGAVNRTTPEMILHAATLVRQGRVATLGKLYASDIPMFGPRSWNLTIPGVPTAGPLGSLNAVFNDELLTAQIGQIGTQFDGPGHIGVRTLDGDVFYNGQILADTVDRHPSGYVMGLGELGVESVGEVGFVCRGILLNAAQYRGVDALPIPYTNDSEGIITDTDIQAMVEASGVGEIREGDCVFIHTGHGDLWSNSDWQTYSDEEKSERAQAFNAGEPGLGRSACEYLASKNIILTGSDTASGEALPVGEIAGEVIPCHVEMQARRGIWNLENLEFTQLIEDGVTEFLFVFAPLKIVGATGSPGNPMALY